MKENKQMGLYQTKDFTKETINKGKRQTIEYEYTFVNYISDKIGKGLNSKETAKYSTRIPA